VFARAARVLLQDWRKCDTRAHMQAHTHAHTHTHTYTYIHTSAHTLMHTCTHIHVHTYTHTHTHTRTHTRHMQVATEDKEAAIRESERCQRKLELANRLITALASEGERWALTVRVHACVCMCYVTECYVLCVM
jgi:hypothetical protein